MGTLHHTSSLSKEREQVERILDMVGLGHVGDSLGRSLSIGDRKRLELAKVLATRPRVVLLDEVLGSLIPAEVASILDLLRKLRHEGLAIVLIEHNMSALMTVSDRILVVNQGREICRGVPSEVSRDPGVLEAHLGKDFASVEAKTC